MLRIFRIAISIDLGLLRLTLAATRLLWEWAGIARRRVEQGLIVVYVAIFTMVNLLDRQRWAIAFVVLVGFVMWRQHREPETRRMYRLLSIAGIASRVVMDLLLLPLVAILLLCPPFHWRYALNGIANLAFLGFNYVVVLPNDDGERGRKSKLAAAKLKEMFGTSWIPQPSPVPR